MISTNDFRTGVTIEVDGEIYTVVDFQHVKPGKGAAFVRSKLKNIKTGAVIEKTFRAGEKIPRAHIDRREMQYLYNSGDQYTLMDMETYDQINLTKEQMGDAVKYLKENMELVVHLYQGTPIGVDLPNSVELEVIETEPGFKGDTATGGSKPAKLETGVVVQVPLFINVGDKIKIDTRTGEYLERV
ncbi:MAG TPA: elongation factor P [Clostridia bacterium]|jgi:elongation factor P|nr:elongation factor P [Clostridia bacterium]